MNIPKALIVAAGFVLILKPPAFAQSSADPYDTWAAASSAQDEGQASQTSLNTDDNQALTETDWWAENDGLTFGYLPGGFGFGLATCGAGSRSTGRGSAWWNAAGTSAWFPAGQQLPYPYGSGWCGNNAYGNLSGYAPWINQVIASPGRHHHLVGKRRTGGEETARPYRRPQPRKRLGRWIRNGKVPTMIGRASKTMSKARLSSVPRP